MVALHPGLYRYQNEREFHASFDAARAQIRTGVTQEQLFLLVGKLTAAIRCGHTWENPLNQSAKIRVLLERPDKLPFRVKVREVRLLATSRVSKELPAKSEIASIDGVPVATLVHEMMPYLRADGSSDGKRLRQLDSGPNGGGFDRWFPLLHPPAPGWRVRIVGEIESQTVTPVAFAAREAPLPPFDESWRFEIVGDHGILTLPTFSVSNDFAWRKFFDDAFELLDKQHIHKLILDLRDNEGGNSDIGRTLLARLLVHPYSATPAHEESAYERVPYNLARFLETWDYGFFDRTGEVTRVGGTWVMRSKPSLLEPAVPRFSGRCVLLTSPVMSSASFVFARDAKATRVATLVGEPTGGNLRGLNGGQIAWLTLPSSGISVDIPLLAQVPLAPQQDQPVQPDKITISTFADAVAGTDTAMAEAIGALR